MAASKRSAPKKPKGLTVGTSKARPIRGPREDGAWYWRAERRVDGRRETIWTGWATRPEAEREIAAVVAAAPETKTTRGTVAGLLDAWLARSVAPRVRAKQLAPSTERIYRQATERLRTLAGTLTTSDLTTEILSPSVLAALAADTSPRTMQLDMTVLSAAWVLSPTLVRPHLPAVDRDA